MSIIKNFLHVINVSNGTNEYYGNFTKQENELIKNYILNNDTTLHLFSGKSKIGKHRIDYEFGNINMDVFTFLENFDSTFKSLYDTVIIDAPYNQKFANKYQKIGNTPKQFIIFANTKDTTRLFNLLKEKINPKRIILKSWNYYIPPGYYLYVGYLCYAGGYRKPTILEILNKK